MTEGKIPDDWYQAKITPISKRDHGLSVDSYLPVSLTCMVCKIMEKLLRDDEVSYVDTNNLISEKQHGFVNKRPYITQLLDIADTWKKILDDSGSIDVTYTDF